ncbi:efflux RND transporter permease subunit [Anaerobacillus alkaliphilus]|uniref:Efflux RND transporter permease subunit n=1 Tax=Anaerobacillus alkaliphilus TaxID=1548597 RepID=A0A4Q0VP67_9BACI|nr:efflux RND transporter permease subunit [Anaerobacillus alkaliphilus]RXI98242.1 efflux RND transporter permease subunit [Anaerobacillus alkaliphilus]
MKIARLSVLKPVAMSMVIVLILILGLVSLRDLPVDLFPELTFPVAAVTVTYEGAGPEEIEQLITRPIEEIMSSIPNVESVSSTSRTGGALILVSFGWGTDMDFATLNMRERLDLIRDSLPREVPMPMVLRFDPSMLPITQLAITEPNGDLITAKKLVENEIKPFLDSVDGVAAVTVEGGTEQEIQLLVDPNKLNSYGVSLSQLQQLIGSENLNLPGGSLQDQNQNLPIRITSQFTSIFDLETLPIPTIQGNVPLGSLVEIKDTTKPVLQESYLNGEPSVGLSVLKASGANTVSVSRAINKRLEELKKNLPEGVEIKAIFDQSKFIEQSIRAVAWNMLLGSILAAAVLYLFLRNMRSTLIIGLSIPISIVTTFLFMYFSGLTLNVLTLGGLALGIGMMVDNAIVILENIYRLRQLGYSLKEAAIEGTSEIGGAIVASTLTTVVVFLPIVFVEGLAAQLFKPLALSVAFSLLASLFTALIIVPLLSSTFMKVSDEESSFQHGFNRTSDWYRGVLQKVLKKPKTTIMITFILFLASFGLTPFIGQEFLPAQDQGFVGIDARLPAGSALNSTYEMVQDIDQVLGEIAEIDLSYVTVGGTDNFSLAAGTQMNRANYNILLKDLSERKRSDVEVAEDIRNQLLKIPTAEIRVSASDSGFSGDPVSITVKGPDIDTLRILSDEVIELISRVDGVREPSSNFTAGNPEITVSINRERASFYGIRSAQVAGAINDATRGLVSTRLARSGDEIDVRLVIDERYTSSIEHLSQLLIDAPTGEKVPLHAIALIERDQGPNQIRRADRLREVTVRASILDRDLGSTINEIEETLRSEMSLPAGYRISFGGQNEQMQDAFFKLSGAIALAVILVYMVMAARFESFFSPFIIMFSVPITVIGVLIGLFITFQPLGVGSLVGILILTGIVVNNGIVLIDYINLLKSKGVDTYEAILEAGPTRLRPILMTALTTILGLIPLTLGFGEGTEIQQPMAIVIVFGLSFATFITLLLIPAIYYVADQWKENRKAKKSLELKV